MTRDLIVKFFTKLPIKVTALAAVGITYSLMAFPALADNINVMADPNTEIFRKLDVGLDTLCVIIMIFAAVFIFQTIKEYKRSTISAAFVYFLIGTLILGAIRVFFILVDDDLWSLHDITLTVGWELLFYLSMIIFFVAGSALAHLVKVNSKQESLAKAYTWLFVSLFFTIIVFIIAPYIDRDLVKYIQNTWFNNFGVLHLVAFVTAGFVALSLMRVKSSFKGYESVITDIYIAILAISLIHLWELLAENWKVISISYNAGELIERILWVPVFLFILYAFSKLKKMTKSPTGDSLNETQIIRENAPVQPEPAEPISNTIAIPVIRTRKAIAFA